MKQSTLPIFPKFTALQAGHQSDLTAMTGQSHPYSDYNFVSLWSWDRQNKLKLSSLNGNLVIRFQDYQDPDDFFYSFWGLNQPDETAMSLLEHSRKEGAKKLKLIPEVAIDSLKQPANFIIQEDRDNFDYIVAVEDMIDLKNNSKKRWSMHQFINNHSTEMSVRELDINDTDTNDQLMGLVEAWRQQMSSRDSYSDSEISAINKMLHQHQDIKTDNLHVLGIYLDDKLKAFSISEILENGFAMGHYKKSDRSYRGLGVALEHHTAKGLQAKGVSHINHEQDLGLEGLRQSKLSHNPVYFLKKYTVSLR